MTIDYNILFSWGLLFFCLVLIWFTSVFHTENPTYFVGYRTSKSLKNKDTWKVAHHLAKTFTGHAILFSLVAFIIVFTLINDEFYVRFLPLPFGIMSVIYIILRVEIKLSQYFDKEGNPKNLEL